MKRTVTDDNHNLLVYGIKNKQYSMTRFKSDYKYLHGGISVKFDGTTESHYFLWSSITDCPTTFMLFGAPLSKNHSFGGIFNDCCSVSTIHHCFLCYYREFEGDAQACLVLYNVHLHKRSYIFARQVGKLQRLEDKYDKNLFDSNAVINFLDAIDDCCKLALKSCVTEFKDHSRPTVTTDAVLDWIEKAPAVFGLC